MQITLRSTTKIVHLNGVPARIWEGTTEFGIPMHAYITRVAVEKDQDTRAFEGELESHDAPSVELERIPLRMII
jgi:hypothetical protein